MMNWRRPLLSLALRVIHPVTARELALLRRLDRAPAAEIRRVHEQRLEALLRHAYGQTDYSGRSWATSAWSAATAGRCAWASSGGSRS